MTNFHFFTLFPKNIIIFACMETKELTAADVWAMFAESDRKRKENELGGIVESIVIPGIKGCCAKA
jgi:hypothetical protein